MTNIEDKIEEKEFTIKNFESNMTIFYYKRTGEISNYGTGIQNMKVFGDYEQEYSLIMDFIIVDLDEFVFNNTRLFRVDIETKELIYLAPYKNKYRIE